MNESENIMKKSTTKKNVIPETCGWIGMILIHGIRAIYAKDMLYIVSNSVGFALNSLLLSLIAFN